MPHKFVSGSSQYWFRWWLVAHLAPSHYLNLCWGIVNWTLRNKLQWNFDQNTKFIIHENASENVVCEMAAILFKESWVISPSTVSQLGGSVLWLSGIWVKTLTHWGRDKMDAISQMTFSSAFSWMKMFELKLKFHWSLFLRVQLTIFQHWFR